MNVFNSSITPPIALVNPIERKLFKDAPKKVRLEAFEFRIEPCIPL